jgi:hypothetical protein
MAEAIRDGVRLEAIAADIADDDTVATSTAAPEVHAPPVLLDRSGAEGQLTQRADMVKKSRAQYEAK